MGQSSLGCSQNFTAPACTVCERMPLWRHGTRTFKTSNERERRHLHRMQDRASADIYRQKHDKQRAASAPAGK